MTLMDKKEDKTSVMGTSDSLTSLKYVDVDHIRKLVSNAKTERDKIIILILFETGCTVNELVNIRVRDIEGSTIHFIASITRNNHPKFARISDRLKSMIESYLKTRNTTKTSYIFEARLNKKITTKRVRQIIQALGKTIGRTVNPQTIRYSHLVHALRMAIPLNEISRQTGIMKSRLVQLLTDLELPSSKDAYDRFHSY